jgi:hypothetical protein
MYIIYLHNCAAALKLEFSRQVGDGDIIQDQDSCKGMALNKLIKSYALISLRCIKVAPNERENIRIS